MIHYKMTWDVTIELSEKNHTFPPVNHVAGPNQQRTDSKPPKLCEPQQSQSSEIPQSTTHDEKTRRFSRNRDGFVHNVL